MEWRPGPLPERGGSHGQVCICWLLWCLQPSCVCRLWGSWPAWITIRSFGLWGSNLVAEGSSRCTLPVLYACVISMCSASVVQEASAKWKSKIARGPQDGYELQDFATGKCGGTGAVCSLRFCLCEVPAAWIQTICKKHCLGSLASQSKS